MDHRAFLHMAGRTIGAACEGVEQSLPERAVMRLANDPAPRLHLLRAGLTNGGGHQYLLSLTVTVQQPSRVDIFDAGRRIAVILALGPVMPETARYTEGHMPRLRGRMTIHCPVPAVVVARVIRMNDGPISWEHYRARLHHGAAIVLASNYTDPAHQPEEPKGEEA